PGSVVTSNLPPRPGLGSSPFLQAQLAAEPEAAHPALVHLAASASFADLPPAGLIWVLNNSSLRHATAGELLRRSGEPSSALLLILQGGAVVQSNSDQQQLGPDQTIDAQALMRQEASNDSVVAGSQGAELLVFPKEAFEALMQRSNQFTCALLRQLSGQAGG
ncbi:MAG: cyclic nucleotide-binding domain-containing protein, partial [Synechococcus sp.]